MLQFVIIFTLFVTSFAYWLYAGGPKSNTVIDVTALAKQLMCLGDLQDCSCVVR